MTSLSIWATEAFILRQSLAGYSCDEISELLEISTGAVMTRLFRARQQLQCDACSSLSPIRIPVSTRNCRTLYPLGVVQK